LRIIENPETAEFRRLDSTLGHLGDGFLCLKLQTARIKLPAKVVEGRRQPLPELLASLLASALAMQVVQMTC
jgi:hypothetical protein